MIAFVVGLMMLTFGVADFRRRVRHARQVSTNPDYAKYIPWVMLSFNWWFGIPGKTKGRIMTVFPFEKENSELVRRVLRSWYVRIVLMFGMLITAFGAIDVAKYGVTF
jgi:hypothetical protein